MILDVQFMSLKRMNETRPSRRKVVVSILDNSRLVSRPTFEGFRDVLRLTFLDVCEESAGHPPGAWPDHPTEVEHEELAELPGERVFSLRDAQEVATFLERHHATKHRVSVIVHCVAGKSRSAAVAAWVATRFNVPLRHLRRQGLGDANPRVSRLLQQVADATKPD